MLHPRKKPGDPLVLTAGFYNDTVGIIDRGQRQPRNDQQIFRSPCIPQVENITEEHLPVFSILQLSDSAVELDNYNEESFLFEVVLEGRKVEDISETYAIIQKDALEDEVVDGVIIGLTGCHIDVTDEDHQYARPIKDQHEYLESASKGSARIRWKESGIGIKKAFVILGEQTFDNLTVIQTASTSLPDSTNTTIPFAKKKHYGEDKQGERLTQKSDHVLNDSESDIAVEFDYAGDIDVPGSSTANETFDFSAFVTVTDKDGNETVVDGSTKNVGWVSSDADGIDEAGPDLNIAGGSQVVIPAGGKLKLKVGATHTHSPNPKAENFTLKIKEL